MRSLNRLSLIPAVAGIVLSFCLFAPAQNRPLVLNGWHSNGKAVFRWDAARDLSTMFQLPANATYGDINMAENNFDYMLGARYTSGLRYLHRYRANGTFTTAKALGSGKDVTDVEYREGNYTVTTFDNSYYEWNVPTDTVSTVDVGYSQSGVTDDIEVAHMSFNMCSLGYTYRVRYRDTSASTIIQTPVRGSDIAFNQRWGSYLLTTQDAILRAERDGSQTTLVAIGGWPKPIAIDPATGDSAVGVGARIYRIDVRGTVTSIDDLSSRGLTQIDGLTLEGWRNLSSDTDRGRTRNINVSFPNSANRYFQVGLSLSLRPGINLGDGRRIQIYPDDLFGLSIRGIPGVTVNFSGMLDANGQATATLNTPAGVPAGTKVFATGVAINPNMSRGLDVANTMILTY